MKFNIYSKEKHSKYLGKLNIFGYKQFLVAQCLSNLLHISYFSIFVNMVTSMPNISKVDHGDPSCKTFYIFTCIFETI